MLFQQLQTYKEVLMQNVNNQVLCIETSLEEKLSSEEKLNSSVFSDSDSSGSFLTSFK